MSESEEIVGASRPNGKRIRPLPTVERIRECFDYDPETGVVRWKNRSGRTNNGDVAGAINSSGYLSLQLDYAKLLAHRVAWVVMTGEWPDHEIDHEDTNPLNNRWANLRKATHPQNGYNAGVRSNNKSGFKGVSYCPRDRAWVAQISVDRKNTHIGNFPTPEAAAAAYQAAAVRFHGEFARF